MIPKLPASAPFTRRESNLKRENERRDKESGMADRTETARKPSLSVLHHEETEIGRLMLRRRWSMALEEDVFEMIVDNELMMSSALNVSERALADRALALLPDRPLQVLVGGLGFGFTALAALADQRVEQVTIFERLPQVVSWHRQGTLPWSAGLLSDPKVTVRTGDFFAHVSGHPDELYDAILIDIDDSPTLLWHHSHAGFYVSNGLESLKGHLRGDGVLALWCAVHPGENFVNAAEAAFASAELLEVRFENPCHRRMESNYLLLATSHDQRSLA
jgi:spermidine synthase